MVTKARFTNRADPFLGRKKGEFFFSKENKTGNVFSYQKRGKMRFFPSPQFIHYLLISYILGPKWDSNTAGWTGLVVCAHGSMKYTRVTKKWFNFSVGQLLGQLI